MKDLDVKVLILSRGRYNSIKTVDILPSYIEVLVPESEEQEYRNRIDNPILTVPDSIKGLGYLRNWVLDNFPERTVIMLDDDISKCYELTHEKNKVHNRQRRGFADTCKLLHNGRRFGCKMFWVQPV